MRGMKPFLLSFTVVGLMAAALAARGDGADGRRDAAIVVINGPIDDYVSRQFQRHVEEALAHGARTIIIELDTPGGLVTASRDISSYIKNLRNVHTIAYVANKAYSGGTMVALACDEIFMNHSAAIGDCAPIIFRTDGGLEMLPPAERAKQEGPIVRDVEESAAGKYDPILARAMVSVQVVVHWVQSPDGSKRRFVDEPTFEKLMGENWTIVADLPDPIDASDTLLTAETSRAIKLGLAKGESPSAQALADKLGLKVVNRYGGGAGDEIVALLNNPFARFFLITVFMTALYAALHAPGHGAAEVIATVSLAALLGIPLLTGYAQWWEIAMVLIGLSLLAIEVFMVPTMGILAVIGIVLLLGGLVMTFVPKEPSGIPGLLPRLPSTWSAVQNGLVAVVAGMFCSSLLSMWLRRFLPSLPYFNRLILAADSGISAATPGAALAAWPLVGREGKAVTELKPGGSAEFLDDESGEMRVTSVVSESGFIERGDGVVVREVAGSRVVVRKA